MLNFKCRDTLGVGICTRKKEIIADVRDMYTSETEGIIPVKAAQHHKNVAEKIIKKALEEAKFPKIDLVAFSRSPGLPPSLHETKKIAEALAKELNVPLIGINHISAHLSSAHFHTEVKDPVYLFVSGANTQILVLENNKFHQVGESLDIAIGNALDKFGREIGLGFPAGPKIEQLALNGKYVEIPYIVKGMDLSFSGIVTHLTQLYKKGYKKEDLCYSFQETCFAMLTEVAERALAHCNKKELVIIGGVAANKRLNEMLEKMCNARKARFYSVPLKYSGDHGLMIAYQGLLEYPTTKKIKTDVNPYERIEEVDVTWKY
ncbi:tRNA (adenosine(37)-N6)-threonylcarbamoyltransferase complex transferase subunit TsaD [Candidatus Woesearchaeota archaeon]|nr:tRNA (adenosine(37)-N6)-threonylcarbamoyltransferase complex transferase subunit TsaD [Candidatus Woesearchaeota archaeon]